MGRKPGGGGGGGGGAGGTSLCTCTLYRYMYVLLDMVWFFKHFGLEQGNNKRHLLVWNRMSVSQKLARRSVIDTLVFIVLGWRDTSSSVEILLCVTLSK